MDSPRAQAPASPQLDGVQFALDDSGRRSSVRAGRAIIAAALAVHDASAAAAATGERDWRRRYVDHWRALVAAQAAQPQRVLDSCRAGLDAAWSELRFVRDGAEASIGEAMRRPRSGALTTLALHGLGDPAPARWAVPYRGQLLSGDALARQIDRWQAAGVCEPSHAQALHALRANPDWFDLSDLDLVLLGAGSQAGPLPWLARWRARIVAVDLPRPALWSRIAETVRSGNATLLAPRAADALADPSRCGADLLTQAPEIAAWLHDLPQPLNVASVAYLDGEQHLRVALAMDAIAAELCRAEPRTSLAYMATATDVFAVPETLARALMSRHGSRGLVKRIVQAGVRAGSGGRSFVPHVESLIDAGDAGRWGMVDALVLQQGPNYALAKRLQQWRSIVARERGHRVSINVMPSTTTDSVIANALLAAGFRGAGAFGVEAFAPATTNAIAAGMWVHDLRARDGKADPATVLRHPLQLISDGANHGGMWQVPYLPRSVLPLAALLGMLRRG